MKISFRNKRKIKIWKKFVGGNRDVLTVEEYQKGQDICEWCGHKKDDDEGGFFPYQFIFKPPGGGGGPTKGTIPVAVKVKS